MKFTIKVASFSKETRYSIPRLQKKPFDPTLLLPPSPFPPGRIQGRKRKEAERGGGRARGTGERITLERGTHTSLPGGGGRRPPKGSGWGRGANPSFTKRTNFYTTRNPRKRLISHLAGWREGSVLLMYREPCRGPRGGRSRRTGRRGV